MGEKKILISWLFENEDYMKEVISLKKHIRESEGYIAETKKNIEKDREYYKSGHTYYKTGYKDDGTEYLVPIGWDENYNDHLENIAGWQEELDYDLELLQEIWKEFKESCPYHTGTYEEEMAIVDAWIAWYEKNAEESQEHTADRNVEEPVPQANGPKL